MNPTVCLSKSKQHEADLLKAVAEQFGDTLAVPVSYVSLLQCCTVLCAGLYCRDTYVHLCVCCEKPGLLGLHMLG